MTAAILTDDTATLLVIDNYDSFTYNLVQMFTRYKLKIIVKRADKLTGPGAEALDPDYILISPGPKDPAHAGASNEIIHHFHDKKPILGVCLGMQCINEVFGGTTVRAPVPVHGKTNLVHHDKSGLFKGIPSPFPAARYHSLMVKIANPDILTTAWNDEGLTMALKLKSLPVFGVQFHPESFLTKYGDILIRHFLGTGVYKPDSD